MARSRMNPEWIKMIKEAHRLGEVIDKTIGSNLVAQWLISFLSEHDVPFKVTNLGAGVKRITTNVDTCPMCKRKL